MRRIISTLKSKNIACGYLYFYIHFITEIASFFLLTRIIGPSKFVWLIPFIYDSLAFVPQSIIGYFNDLHPKMNAGLIGTILLVISYISFTLISSYKYLTLVILCLGNAFIHISGAENTLRASEGKLSHSAIFVGGGSFGVITGKILSSTNISPLLVIPLILTMIPFVLLASTYLKDKSTPAKFDYANPNLKPYVVVLLATLVVIIRGYMGYGIPTSWNKTTYESILLFFTMGIGKCLGGILSDTYGIRKIGTISTLIAIPFLIFGDNLILVSLIGVAMFSMTMSITLAIITSVYKTKPGLAFGFTTIGLFLGTAPIFFIKITNSLLNISFIIIFSILCSFILRLLLKKEVKS